VALAYSLVAGPDGADGFSTLAPGVDAGVGATSNRPPRVGWLACPGFFGPIDPEVAATVKAAAKALGAAGCPVEEVNLPILKETDSVNLLWKLQQMETRPVFAKVTAGHEDEVFRHVK
jgi:aspartyl-tRNA(Asn)/glutamyl-tRNA(Gln) amidotransferase subunit A